MYKDTFRVLSKRLLKHISKEDRKHYLDQISTKLYESEWWKNSEVIAMTIAREIELSTLPIIEHGWKQGKQIVVPKCKPESHEMNFYIFTNQHELENVYLDLYEPKEDPNKLVKPSDIDLMVVPGLLLIIKAIVLDMVAVIMIGIYPNTINPKYRSRWNNKLLNTSLMMNMIYLLTL